MIDLQPFCATKKYSLAPCSPFSHGDWTYATNEIIVVRVPRWADVPENDDIALKIERHLVALNLAGCTPIRFKLPQLLDPEIEICHVCDGSGFAHDCISCYCPCEECDGTGGQERSAEEFCSAMIRGGYFAMPLIRLLASLPGLKMAVDARVADDPMPFVFDGGIGAIMGRTGPDSKHLGDIEAKEEASHG